MVKLKKLFKEALKDNPVTWKPLSYKERQKRIRDGGGLEYLKEMAKRGEPLKKSAFHFGVRAEDVNAYLKKQGVTYRELKKELYEPPKTGRQKIIESGGIEQLRVYAQRGYTQGKVAGIYGLKSSSAISNFVRREGYTWEELQNVCE